MPFLVTLYLGLFLIFLAIVPVRTGNITVDDTSPRWIYNPRVCAGLCDGSQQGKQSSWWQAADTGGDLTGFYNMTDTTTNRLGATASLTFLGTAIYFYGTISPWGGIMNVTLDGKTTRINTKIQILPEQRQSLVYSRTGLYENEQHTLTVTMVGGDYIDVDRVDITTAGSNLTTVPTSPTTTPIHTNVSTEVDPGARETRTPMVIGQSQSKISIGAIVGGSLATAAVLALLIYLGFRYRRRSRGAQIIEAQRHVILAAPLTERLDLQSIISTQGELFAPSGGGWSFRRSNQSSRHPSINVVLPMRTRSQRQPATLREGKPLVVGNDMDITPPSTPIESSVDDPSQAMKASRGDAL